MASAEYYLGSQGAQQYNNQKPSVMYPARQPQYQQQQPPQPWPQQQYNNQPHASTPPPSYSPYALQHEKQQMQAYPPAPPQQQPYGEGYQGSSAPYFPPPPRQSDGYLGPPLQHARSRSQPATRVRFADDESTRLGSETESDSDDRPRRRHHQRRSRNQPRSHDSSSRGDLDSDYSDRDYTRSRSSRSSKTHQKTLENRDTFLGAGAGGFIGDAIFPGLGTAAGLILGGLGGRKYAKDKRSHSEEGSRPHRHRDAYREGREEAREDKEFGRRHRHRDAYHEGKEERRRDRARDSGYGYGEQDLEGGYGRDGGFGGYDEGHKLRGKNRKYGEQGWDAGSATFKSGTAVR